MHQGTSANDPCVHLRSPYWPGFNGVVAGEAPKKHISNKCRCDPIERGGALVQSENDFHAQSINKQVLTYDHICLQKKSGGMQLLREAENEIRGLNSDGVLYST